MFLPTTPQDGLSCFFTYNTNIGIKIMFLFMPSTYYHHNKTHTETTTEIITLPPRPSGGCAHSI